jgi:hypothetical protein
MPRRTQTMRTLNYLPPEKIRSIPIKYVPQHEFCFYLHDMMGHLLVEVESLNIRSATFDLSEVDQRAADEGTDQLIDHLLRSPHRPKAARLMLNHVLVALFSDYLHFVYEGLTALSKRKFAVGISLLRKPFKENLLHISWMLGDSEAYFDKFEADPAMFMESRKTDSALRADIMAKALSKCILSDSFDPGLIERIIFDKDDPRALAPLFDKATHLVTGARALRTEPMNLNFIFKDPRDNDLYQSSYPAIALILMYSFAIFSSELEKVTPLDIGYVRRRLLVAFIVYQALFGRGVPTLYRILERALGDLFKCTVCKSNLRAKKSEIPRLLISERINCRACRSDIHIPILWMMSFSDIDIEP